MNKFLKILAGVALILIAVGMVLSTGKQPAPFPEGSESALRLQTGPLEVHSFDDTFVDATRVTQPNGDYAGADQRRFEGSVWHPADSKAGPYPLIVYSHGFSSVKEGGDYLGEQLASLGYVVVAVNYPLTNMSAPGGPLVKDVVNQPADVSFLIDTMIEQSRTDGHLLEGMIDPERIGVTGISLGGMTSTLVAFHPEKGDERIKAVLSIAGSTAFANEIFFSHRQIPFLMLAADTDALVPYGSNAQPVISIVPNAQLVTVIGGSHTGFAGPAAALRWFNNPDLIGCMVVKSTINDAMAEEDPWSELIGTPEQGIRQQVNNDLCVMDPLPEAMNVLRQHMITSVVVSSFFQSQFAEKATEREAAAKFISEVIADELTEVSYQRSAI